MESLILAAAGGAAGCLLGAWGIDLIRLSIPPVMPRIEAIGFDWTVALFVLGAALGSGILFGVVPAFMVSRLRITGALHQGGRGGQGDRSRLRSTLVVAEVALGLALLVGAGLLGRSFDALTRVDPGFRAEGVLSGRRMVLRQGAVLAGLGLGAGLLIAYTLTESLGSLLFGVSPYDPATFIAVSCVLAASALTASALPARRAARVDPAVALEEE